MIAATMPAFIGFFALTTTAVVLTLYWLKKRKHMSQLGVVYMASMLIKMAFFGLFFYEFLSDLEQLLKVVRAEPLLPLFVGLIIEVLTVIMLVKDD